MKKYILNTRQEIVTSLETSLEFLHIPFLQRKVLPVNIHQIVKDLTQYQGLFFSSIGGVESLFQLWAEHLLEFQKIPVFTLSPKVAERLKQSNFKVQFVPQQSSIAGFLKEFKNVESVHWLHLCSEKTMLNPSDFEFKNIHVNNYSIYKPMMPLLATKQLKKYWSCFDKVLLTSGSIAKYYLQACQSLSSTQYQECIYKRHYFCFDSAVNPLKEFGVKNIIRAPKSNMSSMLNEIKKFKERETF